MNEDIPAVSCWIGELEPNEQKENINIYEKKVFEARDFSTKFLNNSLDENFPCCSDEVCTTDIAIIGSGLTGCSLAYHFHLLGIKTIVLESRNICEGSTGRNGGIMHPTSDCKFELRTAEKMKEFISKYASDDTVEKNSSHEKNVKTEPKETSETINNSYLSFNTNSSCEFITDKGGAILLNSSVPKPDNEDEDILPELATREMKPDPNKFMNARDGAFRRGFHDPMAFSFWPAKVVLALARESSKHACFIPNCKVLSIESQAISSDGNLTCSASNTNEIEVNTVQFGYSNEIISNNVTGTEDDKNKNTEYIEKGETENNNKYISFFPYCLQTNKGSLYARIVIVATNAWIPELLPELKAQFRIVTNTVLQTRNPLPPHIRWPVCTLTCGHGAEEIYINQRKSGHLVIGGLREKETSVSQSDIGKGDEEISKHLQEWIADKFPILHQAINESGGYSYNWKGMISITSDGMPVIGKLSFLSSKFEQLTAEEKLLSLSLSSTTNTSQQQSFQYVSDSRNQISASSKGNTSFSQLPKAKTGLYVVGGFGGHGMPRCFGLAEALVQEICDLNIDEIEYYKRSHISRFFPLCK